MQGSQLKRCLGVGLGWLETATNMGHYNVRGICLEALGQEELNAETD